MSKVLCPLFYVIPALCLFPFVSPPLALFSGIFLAFLYKGEPVFNSGKLTKYLLQISIVLMGFAMPVSEVIHTGKTGFVLTLVSVFLTLLLGILLGRIFKVEKNTSLLISGGTAICGGSAIAAIAPVINAENNQISFSLAVIFILNAVALFVFPVVGHLFSMDETTFGYWAAIAIHDTSSVVGACAEYGEKALQVGTTVKLTRTLWIIPVAFIIAFYNKNKASKISIPWFIALFVIAILIGSYVPGMEETNGHLSWLGRKGMTIALFFIGTSIKMDEVKKVGIYPFLQGVCLWILVTAISLWWMISYF
ncbi:putative sulfate exporter family transporter [Dysgonomonas sp. 216]|uniref:YeiH family protein n=1 Tax=Dysgonomonas sp. 216 TaxID=2302934 RepID=UPI0013D0E8D9|nr:putative sulfate exporter family transporter [Dysgonomonas sp. 216]NDW19007.1 putative sulfate exporter family transporter [Dysgonomonas sp. 216]